MLQFFGFFIVRQITNVGRNYFVLFFFKQTFFFFGFFQCFFKGMFFRLSFFFCLFATLLFFRNFSIVFSL